MTLEKQIRLIVVRATSVSSESEWANERVADFMALVREREEAAYSKGFENGCEDTMDRYSIS